MVIHCFFGLKLQKYTHWVREGLELGLGFLNWGLRIDG